MKLLAWTLISTGILILLAPALRRHAAPQLRELASIGVGACAVVAKALSRVSGEDEHWILVSSERADTTTAPGPAPGEWSWAGTAQIYHPSGVASSTVHSSILAAARINKFFKRDILTFASVVLARPADTPFDLTAAAEIVYSTPLERYEEEWNHLKKHPRTPAWVCYAALLNIQDGSLDAREVAE